MLNHNGYLWIDTETTGVDPEVNALLQVAAVVTGSDLDIRSYFCSYVKPPTHLKIDPRAMEINKITDAQLASAPAEDLVLKALESFINMHPLLIFAGFRCQFDIDFLAAAEKRNGIELSYKCPFFDVFDLAKKELKLPSYKLTSVCDWFEIPTKGAHDAGFDISNTIKVARRLRALQKEKQPV